MNNATYPAKITGLRRQHLFFALCWTAYFSTYIGRLNFTASLAAISAAAGFSQSELGLVSSGFFVGYGIFQLVWGFAGDRLDPVRMVFSGVLCSGLLNLAMACASSPGLTSLYNLCISSTSNTVTPFKSVCHSSPTRKATGSNPVGRTKTALGIPRAVFLFLHNPMPRPASAVRAFCSCRKRVFRYPKSRLAVRAPADLHLHPEQ